MKNPVRIIPILDIKNGLLIKGINLEGLRVLGNARDFAQLYYSHGADEICYQDNVATLYGTSNLIKFVSEHHLAKKLNPCCLYKVNLGSLIQDKDALDIILHKTIVGMLDNGSNRLIDSSKLNLLVPKKL